MEEDDRTKRSLIDSLGRGQQSLFINESGLYAKYARRGYANVIYKGNERVLTRSQVRVIVQYLAALRRDDVAQLSKRSAVYQRGEVFGVEEFVGDVPKLLGGECLDTTV